MIGIIVDNVINSPQMYVLFRELNKLAKEQDCYLFANVVESLPMNHNFAILQQIEALHHKGVLIATSMLNAQVVANSLTPSSKYYYVWGPEWKNLNQFGSQQLKNIYYNGEMKLIARSESHFQLLSSLFQTPHGVVYNWNVDQLKRVVL